jgi:tetratricopeptide (TPR) repeat protein
MLLLSAKQIANSLLSAMLLGGCASPGWAAVAAGVKPARHANVKAGGVAVTQAPVSQASKLISRAYNEMRMQNWGFAISDLCTVLRYQRNNVGARRYLCYSLLQFGNAPDAIAQLDALATLNRGIPFDQCMRGEAFAAMGDTEKAVELLKSALAMDPTSDYVRAKLIDTLQSYGKYQDAAMICYEAYVNAKTAPTKAHYLTLFDMLQQERAILAQKTPGTKVATTSSFPILRSQHGPALGAPNGATTKDTKPAVAADDPDPDTPTPATATAKPITVTNYVTTTSTPAATAGHH